MISENKYMQLDNLVAYINAELEAASAYATSHESNTASFVASLGYNEGTPELDRIDDELTALLAQEPVKKLSKMELNSLLIDSSCLQYVLHMGGISNGIYHRSIGEIAVELGDDIVAQLSALAEEEFDYVNKRADGYITRPGKYAYVNHSYERFALVLDETLLREAIAKLE